MRHTLASGDRTRATVLRLQGCLGGLAPQQRRALQLRAGLGVPSPLTAEAVAGRLHLSARRYAAFETDALARLRSLGRGGCARASREASASSLELGPGLQLGPLVNPQEASGGAGSGGVLGVRFANPRARGPISGHRASGSVFGVSLSPSAREDLLGVLLAIVGGIVLVVFVLSDAVGAGPRHRGWRRRWRERLMR